MILKKKLQNDTSTGLKLMLIANGIVKRAKSFEKFQ